MIFTGDPPSEAQGANSIFDTDISTLEVLPRRGVATAAPLWGS